MPSLTPLERTEATQLIARALSEDNANNDTTSQHALTPDPQQQGTLTLVAKQNMVVAGLPLVPLVFPPPCQPTLQQQDGTLIATGTTLATINGTTQTLLARERSCLNSLQILSGIATLTRTYSDKLRNHKTRILDTRKTIPALRHLSKYATRLGGAQNHRTSLHNTLFIKDNHWTACAGNLATILSAMRKNLDPALLSTLIVECDSLTRVQTALDHNVPHILLDNMSLADMRQAVQLIDNRATIEASGNITLDTIEDVARCGVDYVSVGALTLSAPAADISARLTTT
ncbi:MAG: carboxylating nicotinate-nucleotide diphosphorylase [Alphaproteobacteria bacterium GM202ARS2]|nr:carboxylating nicotinate-nucleotide diphosphorylase [Alphaproteobacteria bacterium GM202ARS2]